MLKLAKENLQKADLVFRIGLDSDSAIISAFDKKGWSHVGFALSSEQIIYFAPKDEFGNGVSSINTQDFIKGVFILSSAFLSDKNIKIIMEF